MAPFYHLTFSAEFSVQFRKQMKRLNMERIDFYLLHGIQDHFAEEMLRNGCIAYFDERKQQGKISYLGFSFHGTPEMLKKLLALYHWDFVQIQLNYYDWYFSDAKKLYEILEEAGIPVMVMEPVHGGLLANLTEEAAKELKAGNEELSLASWAMRWVMELPNVQVILSGMSVESQIIDNIQTFSDAQSLTQADRERIRKVAQIQRSSVAVACTVCRYCCPNCPQGLDIPFLLKNYNEAKIGGTWRISHLKKLPEEQQPAACVGCGVCSKHCPQGFHIPEYLKELDEMLQEM